MSYDFTMWLGGQWGQKVWHFQSSTEWRRNKDIFTTPSFLISTHIHIPGSPPDRFSPKSGALNVLFGEYAWVTESKFW